MTSAKVIAIALALFSVTVCAAQLPLVPDSVRARFDGRETAPIEGIWQIADGSTLLIERDGADFSVVRMHGADLRLPPYTRIGTVSRKDMNGRSYRGRLATDSDLKGKPAALHTFDFTFDNEGDPGILTVTPVRRFKLDLWMLWRMFFTVSVRRDSAPDRLHAVRIWPNPALTPDFPVIL